MKTIVKSVLLGSAAGLAMVGTAAAADLPVKAKAAEYVKICSTYGAGFYYIPGTDTCLRVGGYVTADTYYTDISHKSREYLNGAPIFSQTISPKGQVDFYTRVGVQLDARTQTEYGTVRAYIEGRFEQGQAFGYGQSVDGSNLTFGDSSRNRAVLKYGYIQFAGFTFGQATSAFDFWAGDGWQGIRPGNFYSDQSLNVIQYTADFGNGFSATIALEDGYAREDEFEDQLLLDGQQVPDIVANIAYEGSWGGFKVSGAYHDIGGTQWFGWQPLNGDSSGWAALAGVRFDIADTTTLYVEGAYAKGAPGYLGLAGTIPVVDFDGNAVSGWYIGGSLIHYWTPTVFTSVVGSYTQSDSFSTWFDETAEFSGYNVGVNVGWRPVKGLTLVLQYDYLDAEYKGTDLFLFPNILSGKEETTQNRITFSAKRSF